MVNFYNRDRAISGNTPQQRAKKAAIFAQDNYLNRIAEQEKIRRSEPITGTVTGWDVDQGSAIVSTPDGGQVLAKPLSNANVIGKQLPVQRFQGSQESAINEAPVTENSSIFNAIEQITRQIYSFFTTEDIDVVIDTGNGTYPIITSSSFAYTVRDINSSGTGTGTLSPTIDADIAVNGTLNLTLSGNDDSRWSATIRLRRKT